MTEAERARAKAHYRSYKMAHDAYLENGSEISDRESLAAHQRWIQTQRETRITLREIREIHVEVVAELTAVG